jgi:hypothetical protein
MTGKINSQPPPVATPLPYPPSWFDRLESWVERLPIPSWVFYLGIGFVFFVASIAIEWTVEPAFIGKVNPLLTWLCFGTGYVLALMHYLDRVAARAMETARPTLNVTPQEFDSLRYQLTHLPARHALVIGIAFAFLSIALFLGALSAMPLETYALQNLSIQPLSMGYLIFIFVVTWFLYGTLIFHTIRQLRLVNQIYARHVQINLFALGPLYAFSWITARTAIGWLIIVLFWSIANPQSYNMFAGVASGGGFMLMAAITFILPLLGIHNRLTQEKERLRAENDRRIQVAADDLYQQVDNHEFQRTTALKDSLTALDIHAKTIHKIPTWPWDPETFRTLITALLLPIALFVIQFVLGNVLAP